MAESLTQRRPIDSLDRFQVGQDRGFLPLPDPLHRLGPAFTPWEEIAQNMPKLLGAGKLRSTLEQLPVLDVARLQADAEYHRAMLLLSFFGHGYVWGEAPPADCIPAGVAVPWQQVARHLGRPPVLSYASHALHNWRRLDPASPIALGNIVLLQNFLGGLDEEWFILVHVDIEAKAGQALAAIVEAQKAVFLGQLDQLEPYLTTLAAALEQMYQTLLRMPERCDPYIYYNRVRPYLHGWKDNPALPQGTIYQGVEEYGGKPQRFRGETGAQSPIVPTLDAALGITHKDDPLRPYLLELREYMPPQHRAFVGAIAAGPSIRNYVLRHRRQYPSIRDAYNDCIRRLVDFRAKHVEYAALYIHQQSPRTPSNPTNVGTGGTPFLPYLKKHRDETAEHLIS